MTCRCGHAATRYVIPNPLTGEPMERWICAEPCCRRCYVLTTNGPRWMLEGIWCQDRECDQPTYRMVEYPRRGELGGHLVPLWPIAQAIVAQYHIAHASINGGEAPSMVMQYYCGLDCAPDFGAPPHHPLEAGGDPHPDTIGPCIGLVRAKDRHAECFSEDRGVFFRNWFNDHLRLPAEEIARLMALWESDRNA